MVSIFIRTLIIYVLLSVTLKIMGKRQIGELDVNELVSTLLISEIAAIPIDDPDLPLMNAIIPIFFILSLEIILSHAKTKSNTIKKCVEGHPSFIIYNGILNQNVLKENRISINEFLAEMRNQGVGNIKDIDYAILEQSGKISILSSKNSKLAHCIIIDGEINHRELDSLNIPIYEIEAFLDEKELQLKNVFLLTIDDNRNHNIIIKEEK